VFVWEDGEEEVIEEFRAFEGHKEDILSMAAYPPKTLLATGEASFGWLKRFFPPLMDHRQGGLGEGREGREAGGRGSGEGNLVDRLGEQQRWGGPSEGLLDHPCAD
jgi:hypothetical protein